MQGQSHAIFIATFLSLSLSFVAVSLRCFIRLKIVKYFGYDDMLMLMAMIFNIAFSLCGLVGALYGIGQKVENLDTRDIRIALLLWWLSALFYTLTCNAAKISIAASLLHLTIRKIHIIALWVIITWAVIDGAVSWFLILLQCYPVSYFWDKIKTGKCLNADLLTSITYIYSSAALVSDMAVAIVPLFIIQPLRMSCHSKFLLAVPLSMGCVACVAVAIRIPFIHDYKNADFLSATTHISIFSNIETGLGITAGSLMTIRPLARYMMQNNLSPIRGRTENNIVIPGPDDAVQSCASS